MIYHLRFIDDGSSYEQELENREQAERWFQPYNTNVDITEW